jgi:hypothetical protein
MTNSEPLYVSDERLRQLLGVSIDRWPRVLAAFLADPTFPLRDPIVGTWYWPAIRAWLDHRHGLGSMLPATIKDGDENWGSL